MAAYLDHFEYDLFLSHAWSNNEDNTGDKAWATEFKTRLQRELREKLNSPRVSIFIDTESATNGNVDREFNSALKQSALFLAIVTPAFCNELCFCRKEVEWFSNEPRAISFQRVDVAKRLFKVISRPVHQQDEPREIRDNLRYVCYEGDPGADLLNYDRLPIEAIDKVLGSRLRASWVSLVNQLVGYLYECKQMQARFPISRVFIAETTSPKRDKLIGELRPHEAISVSSSETMTEVEFETATRVLLESCDRSAHLVDTSGRMETPANWVRSKFEIQLACALDVRNSKFRTVVWCDRESRILDSALVAFMNDIWEHFPDVSTLEVIPQGFEYLTSNLKDQCTNLMSDAEPPPLAEGRPLFLQCQQKDLERLQPVFKVLYEQRTRVRLPFFRGKKEDIERLNAQSLSESYATLFYWGNSPDTVMWNECERTLKAKEGTGKLCLLGLDPNEEWRRIQAHPRFAQIPFPADSPRLAVRWLLKALRGS